MGGIFRYSYFTGGYTGGQAEFVRVPLADNNLLRLSYSMPDEKGLFAYWNCIYFPNAK
jgi:threonine dehydrogenase-like Zn-dependent dehydrogenase